ncbi:MAG: AAA family ATPase [Candidatus Promineifilaceae bacterium]
MRLQPVRFVGHRIGPFEHIDLQWHPDSKSTIILGENGAGKSSLIAAISACFSYYVTSTESIRSVFWGKDSYSWLELNIDGAVGGAISFPHKKGVSASKAALILANTGANFSVASESHGGTSCWLSSRNFHKIADANAKVSSLVASYGVWRNLSDAGEFNFQDIKGSPLTDATNPTIAPNSKNITQWLGNLFVQRALATNDDAVDEARSYDRLINRAETFLSQGLQYPIKFRLHRKPLAIKVQQNGTEISISQLSDGTRSFSSWTLDYLMRGSRAEWLNSKDSTTMPGLILVDEIDAHLHPEWQRRVMSSVMELLPETHIIATTHSPFVVGSADNTQLFRIKKGDNGKLTVESSFDKYHGYSADLVLLNEFVDSLYPPEIEKKMKQLSELEGKITFGNATNEDKQKHNQLLEELSEVNPWLQTLLSTRKQHG